MAEDDIQLDERSLQLLKILVERYISDGQPVGSRTLSRQSEVDLSPATIRNVMADLEDLGFIHSPHTSAGRIPTVQGYRLFVDRMLNVKPLTDSTIDELKKQLNPNLDSQELVKSASNILSQITHLAGIVMVLPSTAEPLMRHIEFLPLSNKRVLVILVVNEKEVQNHIIHVDKDYLQDELQIAANYLNDNYLGRSLKQVINLLKDELSETRDEFNKVMQFMLNMIDEVLNKNNNADNLVIDGQTNLMGIDDLSNLDKLKQLFEVFNQKQEILHLLDRCQIADNIQIYIGQESGYKALEDCSVITSPYSAEGEMIGVLGVIGPTRIPYDRVIPIVDITAKLLGSALHSGK